jgi:zinc protease
LSAVVAGSLLAQSQRRTASEPKGRGASSGIQVVLLPSKSPLVSLRFVFLSGAADDPAGKPGLASLTASMIGEGGSQKQSYEQIIDALFPMAVSIGVNTDKEMTVFSAVTHADNLDAFYEIFRSMILTPGWREQDLKRLRDQHINALRINIRSNNDEELGKEVLYNAVYRDHPYGHHNLGTAAALNSISLDDLKKFYAANYTQANLILGLAGGYSPAFLDRVRKDFSKLPAGKRRAMARPSPPSIEGTHITVIDKPTRSVAISIGHPIAVKRGHPDFIPLLVAQTWFGQHRTSGFRLYERIREIRGLNYGDYAYIEYFPSGMFRFEPQPNIARDQQIFQMWIRPLEVPTAHFGLRLALFELDRFAKQGLDKESFERTRSYLTNYVNLLTKTKTDELGYAIDSRYYGIPDYNAYVKNGLAKLTLEDVNRAVKKHINPRNIHIVMVADKAEESKTRILANEPSPMKYNSPKPDEILAEDKIVEKWKIEAKPENVRVVPVTQIFE